MMKAPEFIIQTISKLLHVRPNGESISEVIDICSDLIKNAKKRVHIVSGELESICYTDSRILTSLREAINNKVNVVIIYGPNADDESLKALHTIHDIKLIEAKERPAAHYLIADNTVRIENYHVPYDNVRYAYTISHTSYLAEKMEREFAHLVYRSIDEKERIALS